MQRSKLLVAIVVAAVVGVVALALHLRVKLRCAGFAGPGVTAAELPPGQPDAGELRIAHFNLRNFPLDERPPSADLGFSRRTNICDMEDVLAGLGAQVMGFVEVCDTRRFPPILRRAGGERPMRILFSQGGGGGGQHLAVAWDGDAFELVEGPVEIDAVAVKPGLRPALAVRLRSKLDSELDFTVVEVHLDSGRDDLQHRLDQVRLLANWLKAWFELTGDPDLILQGDFNTMGGRHVSAENELQQVDAILAEVGLDRLDNATGCSQYREGPGGFDGVFRSSLLDLVYLRGLQATGPARSWLHCERQQCGDLISRAGEEDGTFFDVSDHCPVTFEVRMGEE
jgi:endonuclease/exonuclease/phosphatase family metal-dependent hydrolase